MPRIETLDLGFQGTPETIASFLVVGPEGPVLVESGPGSTLPRLIELLGGNRGRLGPDAEAGLKAVGGITAEHLPEHTRGTGDTRALATVAG